MKKPIIFSFFSGSGFLDLGFEHAGFTVEFVNEYHAPFLEAYKFSRKKLGINEPKYGYYLGDIRDISSQNKEDFRKNVTDAKKSSLVGFIGGPPCPDFSVGGKNKGEHGENGVLTKAYVDTILEFTPDFFVFENVKGLWRTKKHREFYDRMKERLSEKYNLTDRLTNCIEYGAPQDRDRIFLFGIRKDLDNDKIKFPWSSYLKYDRETVFSKTIWPSTDGSENENISNESWQKEITVNHWFNLNDVEKHPNSKHHFTPRSGLAKFLTIKEGDVSKKSFKRLHRDRYSPTAAYGNNEVHVHPFLARRISAAEAMAIQSLPKEFELPERMSLTDMFKTIGNGVPYLAAKGLAKTVHDYLNQLDKM
ncbi:DNA cytosine methyltransferase [Citrobacter braakii]|jgi:DNA (cytosine-5)-methyltransferase 1|uniref:DNA cytosine methyltransferase n=1 Tax=Citrobacter braakii TaxID=57706 RepID=UPI001905C731|nr:DNA cytosine methyltransferase [Citrobacter braakii]MBJ9047707.1 DNA cytosine methyltransferase [Citrobacter braakii]